MWVLMVTLILLAFAAAMVLAHWIVFATGDRRNRAFAALLAEKHRDAAVSEPADSRERRPA